MVVKVVARPAGHAGHAMGGEGGGGFVGGAGTDGLTGSACDECVLGGGGSDTIDVGAGVDYVDGGAGRDTISLGADADQDYVFVGAGESARANYDTVSGFVIDADDTAGLQGTAFAVIDFGSGVMVNSALLEAKPEERRGGQGWVRTCRSG